MKSGNLNFLEPSGPLQACNGNVLPFLFYLHISTSLIHLAITIVFIDNHHLSEDGHYRPKHIGQVAYIYKLLPYCCAVGINIVN
jgi:hypothetical protein